MKSEKDASSTRGRQPDKLKTVERIAKDLREYDLLMKRAKRLLE